LLDDEDWLGPLSDERFAELERRWENSRGESFAGPQESWEDPADGREQGLREESLAESWEGPTDGSKGWEGATGGSEAWESSQGEEEEVADREGSHEGLTDRSKGLEEATDEPTDQFCSSCNQKKPLLEFGRFFTCNPCRQRNRKAKQARHIKHKATYMQPKATNEQLERTINALANTSEYKLKLNFNTRALTIEDYLNKCS
jgi:hypothetical protein